MLSIIAKKFSAFIIFAIVRGRVFAPFILFHAASFKSDFNVRGFAARKNTGRVDGAGGNEQAKKKPDAQYIWLSNLVAGAGFEPTTFGL